MNLLSYLRRQNIVEIPGDSNLPEVYYSLLAGSENRKLRKHSDSLAEELYQKELEFDTVVASGIALPHTRVKGIKDFELLFGFAPDGINHPVTGETVYLFLLEISPKGRDDEHIKMLAEIARLVERLQKSKIQLPEMTIETLYSTLLEEYKRLIKE